ncbi:glycoside hydrolase family 88 protein [Paenibacillus thermoaerophilus]|jgi:unsaturated chondroitin disaccharide hydrolase|uniref:Glycoside hydrolase family 88 protein n=1 Tax=Paenibacillus thermoaerophilus TaxID=1215385 RepID=A0ABW2V9B1_9BACL|nr:glycoside hydrolase family 88 protein [Paenibacillus thermoaerophilus]
MWTKAIEQTLGTTRANISRFGDLFPHVSEGDGKYRLNPNTEWTDGFWSGILWLSYEYSGDSAFREAALRTVRSFQDRLERHVELDHHDIGFLYSLSVKAQWIVERDKGARELALRAADTLMKRWRENMQILQAWGPKDDPENGGRIIIDCLMNLPLLAWAAGQTGNVRMAEAARIHADKSLRFLVRGDASTYHTFYFDQQTGDSLRGGTHQGFKDGSTWTRGQAWGIYGFALAYRYFGKPEYLDAAKRLAVYFIDHLPEDRVAYWDFDVPQQPGTARDSSASAIAACGMLEIVEHLEAGDPQREIFLRAVDESMSSLVEHYFTAGNEEEEGFLRHGSYSVRAGQSPDDFVIWGDYFFLEALMRLAKGVPGYWYERADGTA